MSESESRLMKGAAANVALDSGGPQAALDATTKAIMSAPRTCVVNRFQHLDHEIFQFLFSFHAVLLCVCRKSKKIIIKNFNEKKKIKKLFDSHMEERWESKRYRYGRELLVIKKKTTKIAKEQTYNLCI